MGIIISVPLGDIDFGSINTLALAFNKGDLNNERDVLIEHKEDLLVGDNNDLLDIDWSSSTKPAISVPSNRESHDQVIDFDDDLLGVDLIKETKTVYPQVNNNDLDLFGEEIIITENSKQLVDTNDLLIIDEPGPQMIQNPIISQPQQNNKRGKYSNASDNPYLFLDNIHTLETVKSLHNHDFVIEDDEFVESDVTFTEPPKIHAFESSDLIIQYSSKQVF